MKNYFKTWFKLILVASIGFSMQVYAAKPVPAPPLTITNLVLNPNDNTALISGLGFNLTTTANIELAAGGDLYEFALTVLGDSTDTVLHVSFGGGLPPAGSYGLLVKNTLPTQSATFNFTVGATGPKGDPGDPAPVQTLNKSITAEYAEGSADATGLKVVTATCTEGTILTGGGFFGATPGVASVIASKPSDSDPLAWEVKFYVSSSSGTTLTAYAMCLDLALQ